MNLAWSFTGTRWGMSDFQKLKFEELFEEHRNRLWSFSHGCCMGSDIQAHAIARRVCGKSLFIAVFPSDHWSTRAPIPDDADFVADEKPPLARNKDIVDNGRDLLVATPYQDYEIRRSGTWAAIRYAKSKNVKVEQLLRVAA